MIPVAERERKLSIRRNGSGFLLGGSWSHHESFPFRKTHLYLGWWVLTVTTHSAGTVSGG